jgi:NAD(P)-dependent dehydrogenase (short-subunit alcohol dehydrogenase family)
MITYSASKAAVSMLTVQYAKALPGVKVNAVEPGFTSTDLTGEYEFSGQPIADAVGVIVRMATIGKDGPPAPSRRTRANCPGNPIGLRGQRVPPRPGVTLRSMSAVAVVARKGCR